MLTFEQIAELHKKSRDGIEFAQACYLAGRREQRKADAALAKQFDFSRYIGAAISEEILRAER